MKRHVQVENNEFTHLTIVFHKYKIEKNESKK